MCSHFIFIYRFNLVGLACFLNFIYTMSSKKPFYKKSMKHVGYWLKWNFATFPPDTTWLEPGTHPNLQCAGSWVDSLELSRFWSYKTCLYETCAHLKVGSPTVWTCATPYGSLDTTFLGSWPPPFLVHKFLVKEMLPKS